jgi:NDP-sugar pyrophosphorylase family protein
LGNDVRIEGAVRLGSNVSVGRGVRIVGPTVIGDNVRIGDGAVVERSILWDAATIGARVCVRGSIVGIDYDVPADTALIDRIVANEPIST